MKCPQCSALVEANPGQKATCAECGYEALVPAAPVAAAPSSVPPPVADETPREPVPPKQLLAPFGYISGVIGLGTFYLAAFIVPLLFAGAALGLGLYVHVAQGKSVQATAAIVLGVAGLVLGLLTLVLA